eukprot:158899-Prymnesium_polylepis.1
MPCLVLQGRRRHLDHAHQLVADPDPEDVISGDEARVRQAGRPGAPRGVCAGSRGHETDATQSARLAAHIERAHERIRLHVHGHSRRRLINLLVEVARQGVADAKLLRRLHPLGVGVVIPGHRRGPVGQVVGPHGVSLVLVGLAVSDGAYLAACHVHELVHRILACRDLRKDGAGVRDKVLDPTCIGRVLFRRNIYRSVLRLAVDHVLRLWQVLHRQVAADGRGNARRRHLQLGGRRAWRRPRWGKRRRWRWRRRRRKAFGARDALAFSKARQALVDPGPLLCPAAPALALRASGGRVQSGERHTRRACERSGTRGGRVSGEPHEVGANRERGGVLSPVPGPLRGRLAAMGTSAGSGRPRAFAAVNAAAVGKKTVSVCQASI